MRLCTVVDDGGRAVAGFSLTEDAARAYALAEAAAAVGGLEEGEAGATDSVLAIIAAGPTLWPSVAETIRRFAAADEAAAGRVAARKLLAPIPRPGKNVICVGRNYLAHAQERGDPDAPEVPVFFTKAPTAVVGPGARVPYPAATEQFDYEGELAVIIGRRGKYIPQAQAWDYVFGYTIVNDLTARDVQKGHKQWFRGKSFDGTCPMGPAIVTRDEMGELGRRSLTTRVNGEVRQEARLSQMVFDVPALIEVLSDGMTLEPGDVIATGTPGGVGAADGRFLEPGDRVEVTIEGLGTLVTSVGPREADR